jgi:UDP-glucose 4-epimerase
MKKVLITGGSGFVGQNIIHLIKKLNLPIEVFNLDRTMSKIVGVNNIQCIDASDFNFETINEKFDCVIHTLALSNNAYCKDFEYAQKVNIQFTKKLLEFCRTKQKIDKFIYISSIIVYDNSNTSPVNENAKLYLHYSDYGFTKGISEYYVEHYREKFGIPAITFRLSNIYGPYQSFIDSPFLVPSKIIQGLLEKKIEVFDLSPRRDWIYAEDAAEAIIKAVNSSATGIFNLGSGIGINISEIIEEIATQLNVPYKSLNKTTTGPKDFYCDVTKTKNILNWEAKTNLKSGIANTIKYIKENIKI